jgi:Asp-tRNA(Asn)/Glu-tRNA(Gln) amidotransferase A subunit family amidase
MTYEKLPALPVKIPLATALTDLVAIMSVIDSAEDIDAALTRLFGDALANVGEAVDRRILFKHHITHEIALLKDMAAAVKEKQKALENALERFEKSTLEIMASEESVRYRGKLGELCSQKNPAKLELTFETKTVNFSNAILTDTVGYFDIPKEFLQEVTFNQLLTAKVKEALQAGAKYEWAQLIYNRHLRVRV